VGGGKTTFVRGLAEGIGSSDAVSSPSFTIEQVYKAPKFELHHFDFYRLSEPGLMKAELAEAIAELHNVVIVEWGQSVEDVLPTEKLIITMKRTGEAGRELHFTCPASLSYLLEGLK
jgi:tRNA threonylcarbamoyladenosine biosynthesis protein TsaE